MFTTLSRRSKCVQPISGARRKALKALSAGIRFQNSTTVLPTKEQLFFECGIPIDRNFREFKINKELFPYPELHGVVRFDRKRKGYFLCLNKSE